MTLGLENPKRMITTVDSHTAGHPTRVVTGGLPLLKGRTVAERCDYFRLHHDDLRTFLLHEPRGHAAMVGAVLTESEMADFGAFFLSSYKYLEMCGHATIGVAVTLDHLGLIAPDDAGLARFSLEVPAGVVMVAVQYKAGRIGAVTFDNVPAFVAAADVPIEMLLGQASVDIAYGGNWYGLVEAASAKVALTPEGVSHAMATGASLKAAINRKIADGAITGTSWPIDSILFYEASNENGQIVSRQLVILESNKFDRSPCGTGTSARLAQLVMKGVLQPGETIRSRNILGIDFTASAELIDNPASGPSSIRPKIIGLAHVTGHNAFLLSPDDPLPSGFLCR